MKIRTYTPLIVDIVNDVNKAETKAEKLAVLKQSASSHLLEFFRIAYAKNDYDVVIPTYRESKLDGNFNHTNLYKEMRKLQHFTSESTLKPSKKTNILKATLETIRADEAALVIDIITGRFIMHGLSEEEVKEALLNKDVK